MGKELQAKRERYEVPGVISKGAAYAIDEFRARMRWTPSACRAAKKAGLEVVRIGKRDYVTGSAAIAFIEQQGQSAAENN